MDHHPPPDSSAPPSPSRPPGIAWRKVLIAIVVGFPVTVVGLGLLAFAAGSLGLLAPPGQSSAHLTGVAVFGDGSGVRVCSRRDLHNCRLTRGVTGRRERYFAIAYTLHAVPSCDGQVAYAYSRCEDAGAPGPRDICMGSWGVFGAAASSLSDPRDAAELEPTGFSMRCDEGGITGNFPEEGL